MQETFSIKDEIEQCFGQLLTDAQADDEDAFSHHCDCISGRLIKAVCAGERGEWELALDRVLDMMALPAVRDCFAIRDLLLLIRIDFMERLCEKDRTRIATVLEENCPLFKSGPAQLVALEMIADLLPDGLPLKALDRISRLTIKNARICVPNALRHFVGVSSDPALRERTEKMLEAMCDDPDEDMRNEAKHYLALVRRDKGETDV